MNWPNHWGGRLKPNCLMTQKPLVFLFSRKFWLQKSPLLTTASMLSQHGYEVYTLQVSSDILRSDFSVQGLEDLHVFYGAELTPLVDRLLVKQSLRARSLNCLAERDVHAWALNQCQKLAEMDFFIGERSKTLAQQAPSRQTVSSDGSPI
jgi:hypothetical protein